MITAQQQDSRATIIVNGNIGDGIEFERGIKQGCPLSMYLYIIYIEPLIKIIKRYVAGLRLDSKTLIKICGYVDDIVICTNNEGDFDTINKLVGDFEEATNAKVNREKTKMMGVGKWEKKEKWKFDWLKNEGKIKILGFTFMPDMKRTIKLNMKTCIDKIRNTVGKAENRIMTELQKVLYSNAFVVPKIIHVIKIIPLNRKSAEKCNKIIHRFIWSRKIEKLRLEEMYPSIEEGGMNLVDIFTKSRSIFLDTIIRLVMNEGTNNNIMNYWLGPKINFLTKKTNTSNIPFIETPPQIFAEAIETLCELHQNYPEKDLNALKSRDLYHLLIPLEWLKPKALEKNANIEAQSCKNLKKLKINPKIKQHMFNQIHNILETRERMARCKQTANSTCPHCQEVESTTHIFTCRTSAQAIQWLYKEMGKT